VARHRVATFREVEAHHAVVAVVAHAADRILNR
jgi:hypothetical protein